MAIIQQGQKRDNRMSDLSALAGIIMQVMQYKQKQDALAYEQNRQQEMTDYGRSQQEGYGRDVSNVLRPYKEQQYRTRPTTEAEQFSEVLKGMNREQLDSMLEPYPEPPSRPRSGRGFGFMPSLELPLTDPNAQRRTRDEAGLRAAMQKSPQERRFPTSSRYNIKRDQMPGIQAALLEAGANRPKNVRINPMQLSGMFDRTGGSGGSRLKNILHEDAEGRVGLFDPYTFKNIGGDPKTAYTAPQKMTMQDVISGLGGGQIETRTGRLRRQGLREASGDTINRAAIAIKKMKGYDQLSFNGRQQLLREYLEKRGLKMPRVTK